MPIEKKETLLEKAKKVQLRYVGNRKDYSDEEIEVGLAWLRDEITPTQAIAVLNIKSTGNFLSCTATLLKQAYKKGLIKIV